MDGRESQEGNISSGGIQQRSASTHRSWRRSPSPDGMRRRGPSSDGMRRRGPSSDGMRRRGPSSDGRRWRSLSSDENPRRRPSTERTRSRSRSADRRLQRSPSSGGNRRASPASYGKRWRRPSTDRTRCRSRSADRRLRKSPSSGGSARRRPCSDGSRSRSQSPDKKGLRRQPLGEAHGQPLSSQAPEQSSPPLHEGRAKPFPEQALSSGCDQPSLPVCLISANSLLAPGNVTWSTVCRYFSKDTSQDFKIFRQELLKCEEVFLHEVNQSKEIERFQQDFNNYAQPLIDDLDSCTFTAKKKLWAAMIIPMTRICSFSSSLNPSKKYLFRMEQVVSSIVHPKKSEAQLSDLEILELQLVSSSSSGQVFPKTVALVELKHGLFPQVKSRYFSQLLHATALAYNAGKWQDRLLCCLASLRHWHLFIVEVHTDSSGGKHFAITKYYHHAHVFGQPYVDFYSSLVVGISQLIVYS